MKQIITEYYQNTIKKIKNNIINELYNKNIIKKRYPF